MQPRDIKEETRSMMNSLLLDPSMIRHNFPDHHLDLQAPPAFGPTHPALVDNFLDHLLASLPSGQWPDLAAASTVQLAGDAGATATDQPHILLLDGAAREFLDGGNGAVGGDPSSFNCLPQGQAEGNFASKSPAPSGLPAGGGAAAAQPKKKIRARRGQATDPHSIAERLRRVKISERMKALQELVPNANKTDKASMLDEIIEYVKFLQVQVKLLSMSRLGGASGAVAPFPADISSQHRGGGPTIGPHLNGDQTARPSDSSPNATEQRVAKLMEEDMGSAMQYLQGKGLCLMPISLAATISTTAGSRGTAVSSGGSG
ncbi:transcription factor bHLH66-like isoform X2 [Punica granatum]|uniref:Transcription factor bHLH66-like isoform X2 n=1 Tax=Punica granatum TaxID=22663 RepID=A0A218WJ37_PUNGR|nr:transcription factor bHLH66-like isoform X2 [Punica granatum]OWM72815.1 hypothetical protein CDL15_Pgr021121 [Punica granatum]